jgi:hypothetical protein
VKNCGQTEHGGGPPPALSAGWKSTNKAKNRKDLLQMEMPSTGNLAKEAYIVRKIFKSTVNAQLETLLQLHGETLDAAGIF